MAVNENTLTRRYEGLREPSADATVIDRVRYLITRLRKTQQQFAELLGVDGPNLSRILNQRIPLTDSMINRIVVNLGVSKEWLLRGTDVPFPKNLPRNIEVYGKNDELPMHKPSEDAVPVYNIDATAGFGELSSMFTDEHIIGYVDIPEVRAGNVIIRVFGNSMQPEIPDMSYIAIHPVNPSTIFWGQTYLVVTDDYRMVKILRRHSDPQKVILRSNNPDYDDMEIDRNQIKALYVVDAVMNYKLTS